MHELKKNLLGMFIIADIGGTNARLELLTREQLINRGVATFSKVYSSASVESLQSLINKFTTDSNHSGPIAGVFCGIPGDVVNNMVDAVNLAHWGTISGVTVAESLNIPKFQLVNDFEAAAYILNALQDKDVQLIRRGSVPHGQVKTIIGLGTGLGVSFAPMLGNCWKPCASESGFVPFWECDKQDHSIAHYIRNAIGSSTVAFEHVCSGSGLVNVYNYVCHTTGSLPHQATATAVEICKGYETNPNARKACDIVLEYLGRFISVLSLIYKPVGGIYLTGGTMDSLGDILLRHDEGFERGIKCRDHPVLVDIACRPSVYLIRKPNVGVCGIREYAVLNISNT